MLEEDIYETAHLEILPPRQRSGVQDLSSQDSDGLWRITCLNSHRNILLYNDSSYWNKKLKADFISSVPITSFRNSTCGIRATTATTERKKPSNRLNGGKKCLIHWIRRPCPENDHLPINFNSSKHI